MAAVLKLLSRYNVSVFIATLILIYDARSVKSARINGGNGVAFHSVSLSPKNRFISRNRINNTNRTIGTTNSQEKYSYGTKDVTIVCNWKCYLDTPRTNELIEQYAKLDVPSNITMITSPASIHLRSMIDKYKEYKSKCIPCSQDVSACATNFGPFTGEVTAGMLKDFGVNWTIVGHSERREFSEASIVENRGVINKKVKNALKSGLNVILCVGEPKTQIDAHSSEYVISQLESLLDGVEIIKGRLIVAYEPSYSVGTGTPVEPTRVNGIIADIKKWLDTNAVLVKFIYGGSVDENNASLYVKQENIDGIMVGRTACSENFGKLVENVIASSNL